MSSTKRRLKRKLALLAKIHRAVAIRIKRGNSEGARRLWATSAEPLDLALWRKRLDPQFREALNFVCRRRP